MTPKPTLHIIVKYFFPVAAGIETNIAETYSFLVEKGYKVILHTSTNTLTETNALKKSETIRGIIVKRYPWKWFGFWPKLDTKPGDLVCLHNFNVVPHIFFLLVHLKDRVLGNAPYRLVLTPHGGFTPEWSTFPVVSRILKWLYHRTVAVVLTNLSVDGIRAVSSWEKREMVHYGLRSDLITVIDNGIESMAFENTDVLVSSEYKKKIKALGTYIIQVGRIHPIKNFETVIQALPNIDPSVSFVIAGPVGDPEYKLKLEQLAKDLGVDKRLVFFGVIRGPEKFYLMKNAQMMVHMALWESYCNVVHEGMSQGLVCVVANNTALPLLIADGKNGYCLPTHDTKQLGLKIQYILDHKTSSEIKTIEKNNADKVKEHAWTKVALRMGSWYQAISTGVTTR